MLLRTSDSSFRALGKPTLRAKAVLGEAFSLISSIVGFPNCLPFSSMGGFREGRTVQWEPAYIELEPALKQQSNLRL